MARWLVSIAVHDELVIWVFFSYVYRYMHMSGLSYNMEAFVVFNLPHLGTILF